MFTLLIKLTLALRRAKGRFQFNFVGKILPSSYLIDTRLKNDG